MKIANLSEAMVKVWELQTRACKIKPKPIEKNLCKLMEEVGEIAQDVLKLDGYKVNKEKVEDLRQNLKEEIVDAMVMLMVLAMDAGTTEKEMCTIFEKKLNKWVSKHIEPKEQKRT